MPLLSAGNGAQARNSKPERRLRLREKPANGQECCNGCPENGRSEARTAEAVRNSAEAGPICGIRQSEKESRRGEERLFRQTGGSPVPAGAGKTEERQKMPWDIQMGFSKRMEHAPFRFSVTAMYLNRWKFDYIEKTEEDDGTNKYDNFFPTLLKHLVFGIEFIPSDNFWIGAGFNPKTHYDMKLNGANGFGGFSAGAGVDVLGVFDPLPLFEGGKAVEVPPQAASPKTQAKADNDKNNFFVFFI